MRLISWNMQWGRGADGRVDLSRRPRMPPLLGGADALLSSPAQANTMRSKSSPESNTRAPVAS